MSVYQSPHESVPLVHRSIYTHLFASSSPSLVGPYPASSPAFVDATTGHTLTRAALRSFSLQLAHSLLSPPPSSIRPQPHRSTLLIFSPNTITWPIMLYAASAAGLRATLANSAYTPTELAHQYADSRAQLILAHPSLVHTVRAMLRSLGCQEDEIRRRVIVAGSTWLVGANVEEAGDAEKGACDGLVSIQDLLGRGELKEEVKFDGNDAHETAVLCYSSGTTGNPKGVETTHHNLTSVTDMLQSIFPATDPKKDVFFGVLPFYHIYGAVKLLLFPFSLGLPVVLTPRFAPTAFCAAVEHYKVTIALIVPPLLVVFARDPAIKQHDLRSLTMLFSGAAPLGAKLVKTVRERLLTVGADVCITQGYGLTETSPTTHLLHPKYSESHVGSVGHLCPNLEARLVDEEGEVLRDVNPGESGELWIRGPTIMKGYLNNPSATKASVTPEGWFKTGDIAVRDKDGFYTIVDRRKELIKYKGFQVPPAELESLLLQHPDIADAAVIGVESKEEATELPRAYVVHANPSAVSTPSACIAFEANVQAWVAERVARHKKLRGGVVVIPLVPKSAAGKILRRELRERAKKEEATGQVKAKL